MSESQTTADGTVTPTPDGNQNLEGFNADVDAIVDAQLAAENAQERVNMIAGIRALADFLENHPQVGLPYSLTASVYAEASAVRDMTHLSGSWGKQYNDYNVEYAKVFSAPSRYYSGSVRLVVSVPREQVCKKIQVGTKHVEATEAHDEPVYEWKCTDAPETDEYVDRESDPERTR